MNMIKLSKCEKETILRTSKGDEEYSIFTFDKTLQKKLERYAEKYPQLCKLVTSTKEGSKTYVVDKTRVSIRLISPCSEERKRKMINTANRTFRGQSRN